MTAPLPLVGRAREQAYLRDQFTAALAGQGGTAFAGGGSGDVANQAALFATVRESLTTIARARPLALVLDDLHWADLASLNVLRFLARDIAALPALLLVTYRAELTAVSISTDDFASPHAYDRQ